MVRGDEDVRGAEVLDDGPHGGDELLHGIAAALEDPALRALLVAQGVDRVVVDVDHVRIPHELEALRAAHLADERLVLDGDAGGVVLPDDLLPRGARGSLRTIDEDLEAACAALAPSARYYPCNETLRPLFYTGTLWHAWEFAAAPVA